MKPIIETSYCQNISCSNRGVKILKSTMQTIEITTELSYTPVSILVCVKCFKKLNK